MTCRSFRVWTFAFALLGSLAIAAHAGAKPPDLPVDPNDTIPLLAPPPGDAEPEDDCCKPAQPMPMPEPMPGWPTITIESGEVSQYGIWTPYAIELPEPTRTLTVYPGPNGVVVSINPEPMPAPKAIPVYHAVRPHTPLSTQRTYDECLLIGAHPLLSLVPLPESLRQERHTQEMVPVAPLPAPQTEDGIGFEFGVQPPCMPNRGPCPVYQFNVSATGAGKGIILPSNSYLIATLTPDLSIPISPSSYGVSQEPASQPQPCPETAQVCPYHGPCDRHVPAIGDDEISHSVQANLEKLIKAEKLYYGACKLVKHGHYAEAIECLHQACGLCPGSRYDEMSTELVSDIVCRVLGVHCGDKSAAEESDEPPSECEPYWDGDDSEESDEPQIECLPNWSEDDAEQSDEAPMECLPNWSDDDEGPKCPEMVAPPQSSAKDSRCNEVVLLRNAPAAEVANSMSVFMRTYIWAMLSHSAFCQATEEQINSEFVVVPDPITNKLLISVDPKWYPVVMAKIQELDADHPQIMIEALIAEINLDGSSDWLTAGSDSPFVFSASQEHFNQLLRNLKTQGRIDILSRPQIMTLDNQAARVVVGQAFPIITGTTITCQGFVSAAVTYEPVGVGLVVTPKILPDGQVLMQVKPSLATAAATNSTDSLGLSGVTISRRTMETTVLTGDGKTVAIVGAFQQADSVADHKVPCVSDLPGMGTLFHFRTKTKSTSEMLILLTPHIVRNQAEADKLLKQESKCTDKVLKQDCPSACGMPCCEAHHLAGMPVPAIQPAPCCGERDGSSCCDQSAIKMQIAGLIKACHLALGCGRLAKAAQLAREAYALNADTVKADPVVYKMHLLALKMDHGGCACCGDGCCCEGKECTCPCCGGTVAVKGCCVMSGLVDNNNLPKPCCLRVQMLPPSLPPVDGTIVLQLQKLIAEPGEAVTEKAGLEVVEEESETNEAPKAMAKPFRVQPPVAGKVISLDEVLKFMPGETWTEFDPKSNHLRALYRVRVGNAVYCVRYDGELSVDLSVTPAVGGAENCEDHK